MKLSAAMRKKIPPSQFAGPGRTFPVPDATHAKLAIPMATRSERAGNISPSTAAKIKTKARAKLDASNSIQLKDGTRRKVEHGSSSYNFKSRNNLRKPR